MLRYYGLLDQLLSLRHSPVNVLQESFSIDFGQLLNIFDDVSIFFGIHDQFARVAEIDRLALCPSHRKTFIAQVG